MYIRPLTPADLDLVETVLSAAYGRPEGWREEVELFLSVAPDGWLVAELDDRVVGMGGATDYGPFAWIGLMAVDPGSQRRGIGRLVLKRILAWIRDRGCPLAVLDASAAGEPLYRGSGFLEHGSTVLLRRDGGLPATRPSHRVSVLDASQLEELADFDAPIFGANRAPLLAALLREPGTRALAARGATGQMAGYVTMQPDRLGPWVAVSPEAAEALLSTALSVPTQRPLTVRSPSLNSDAGPLLRRYGFAVQRSLRHMYLGASPPPQDRAHIYSEASFAAG